LLESRNKKRGREDTGFRFQNQRGYVKKKERFHEKRQKSEKVNKLYLGSCLDAGYVPCVCFGSRVGSE
jgi:hypothetical protein